MKNFSKLIMIILVLCAALPVSARAASWKPAAPEGYTPISWVGARGINSFMQAPEGSGYIDFITVINLAQNQIRFISSSSSLRVGLGEGSVPFSSTTAQNWGFAKIQVERTKQEQKQAQFIWNAPFFNVTIPTSDLSLSLKSSDASGEYVTSGSRPESDIIEPRRMLIIDNKKNRAEIINFDEQIFLNQGDQAVEGFDPLASRDTGLTARLYLGVREEGRELVVYCSRGATTKEASDALIAAGVLLENQLQADGGASAACGYNLPGQYFVEPGRTLTHLMGAFPILFKGKVTVSSLNVRSGPSTKFSSVRRITSGTEVVGYEEKDGWIRISKDDIKKEEWISKQYVKQL